MVGDILQPTHLLFVLVVALLVLGPKRLPEVGRTLGNGLRDFRSAINGEDHETRDEIGSHPWHNEPDPEDKHEFAHTGETTPESHAFAHDAPGVSASAPEPVPDQPDVASSAQPDVASSAQPAAASPAQPAPAPPGQPQEAPAAPAATGDSAATPDKHEFAYESPEASENPSGPART